MKIKNIQSLLKKWIVKRPKGMCQILFSLTELDDFCDEIEKEIFDERILNLLEIIKKESKKTKNQDERNGYDHSYAIFKTLLNKI